MHSEQKTKLRQVNEKSRHRNAFALPQDALRHTFATYYLKANIGTQDSLRWAMGHSGLRLIHTRYMNMAGITRAMATEWWQILPE